MKKPILVDTNVLVDFLRGQSSAVAFVRAYADRMILSTLTVAELYAGFKDEEEAALAAFIALSRIVAVSTEIAKAGGRYRRDYGKSHGVGLTDAILAATADAENAELATLNTKHFPMFPGLRPAYTK